MVEEFQRKASGRMQVTRSFIGNARVRTAFGKERNVPIQTVPLNLTMDPEAGKFRVVLSLLVLPGEGHLVILDQKTRREVFSSDARADLRQTVMDLSVDERRSHFEENGKRTEKRVDVRASGDGMHPSTDRQSHTGRLHRNGLTSTVGRGSMGYGLEATVRGIEAIARCYQASYEGRIHGARGTVGGDQERWRTCSADKTEDVQL